MIGKFEGRQKLVPDGSEKGLESLGRPTNDYFKNQYSKNDKAIGLKSDGKDYSNVDFGEHVGDASNPEDLKFKKYYREEILPKDPNYKKVKFLVSTGTNMIPGVGEVKLGIEIFVGEDLLTKEKYDLIDIIQTTTMLSKNIASRGMNRLENQLSDLKNNQNVKTELYTKNQQGQNGQQHQINQNNVAQNNKNSINKTQPQGNQGYSGNQQVSKGSTSNNQQGAPVSKTSDITKASKNVEKVSDVSKNITDKVKNPLQDVSNIVDRNLKKVDSSGEYLMNAINDNKTNYYLDYKVAEYYASDIRNMTLTEMRNVGTRGWNKTVRMLKGDAKDAYNFYRARAVEIMGSRNIEKKFPDGSLVEQVLTEGFDKNGYKINFRNFSTEGEGNYPTIDLYNTNGKSKYEIKFEE